MTCRYSALPAAKDISVPRGSIVQERNFVILRVAGEDSSTSNGGVIAGAIIGSIAGILLIAGLVVCYRRRQKSNSSDLFERLAN
jgi:hypothetical protein